MSSPVWTASGAAEICRQWIEMALPTLNEVVYARQALADAPRPAEPYATVHWASDRGLSGTLYEHTTLNEVAPGEDYDHEQLYYELREGTLRVGLYADDPFDLLSELRSSQLHIAEMAHLRDAAITVRSLNNGIDNTELRDTEWEPAVIADYAVGYRSKDSSNVAIIETILTPITLAKTGD